MQYHWTSSQFEAQPKMTSFVNYIHHGRLFDLEIQINVLYVTYWKTCKVVQYVAIY